MKFQTSLKAESLQKPYHNYLNWNILNKKKNRLLWAPFLLNP